MFILFISFCFSYLISNKETSGEITFYIGESSLSLTEMEGKEIEYQTGKSLKVFARGHFCIEQESILSKTTSWSEDLELTDADVVLLLDNL